MALSAYCWPHSAVAGATIPLCISSSFGPVHVTVTRVAATRGRRPLRARARRRPPRPRRRGAQRLRLAGRPRDPDRSAWRSGFYEVALEPVEGWPRGRVPTNGKNLAFFVLHPAPGAAGRILLVLGTNTWLAYNDFGGVEPLHRRDARVVGPPAGERPPRQAARRGPPRRFHAPARPRARRTSAYIALEHLTQWAGSAGWPNYEQPFLAWADARATRSTSRRTPTSNAIPTCSTACNCCSASGTTSTGRARSATRSRRTSSGRQPRGAVGQHVLLAGPLRGRRPHDDRLQASLRR